MTDYKYFEASPHDIRAKALWPLLVALLVVAASFLIPPSQGLSLINSVAGGAEWAVRLSDSAKTLGIAVITLLAVTGLASRRRLSLDYRLKESVALIGAVILFAGGGALLNEHQVKPVVAEPRPNVVWLSQQPEVAALGFTAEAFYARRADSERPQYMQQALSALATAVPPTIAAHWVSEPGYSLPSGHAFASFFVATFLLLFATSFVATTRQLLFYLLVPWAVAVSLSRVLLQVHRPVDIVIGATMGLILGIVAWLIVRVIVRKLVQSEIGS